MNNNSGNPFFDNLDEKINLAIRKALERHKKLGESVVISDKDKITTYQGDEIQILLDRDNQKE